MYHAVQGLVPYLKHELTIKAMQDCLNQLFSFRQPMYCTPSHSQNQEDAHVHCIASRAARHARTAPHHVVGGAIILNIVECNLAILLHAERMPLAL